MSATIVGRDHVGRVAEHDGIRFYVTECCGASAKGSANSPTGVCCRACHFPVDAALGGIPVQAAPVSVDAVAQRRAAQAALQEAAVRDALGRVGMQVAPGVEVERLSSVLDAYGLYRVVNPDAAPGSAQAAREIVVFDDFPVAARTRVTGYLYAALGGGAPVGYLYRGDGRTREPVSARALEAAQGVAAEVLS
jgi:hypothetical protein